MYDFRAIWVLYFLCLYLSFLPPHQKEKEIPQLTHAYLNNLE